MRLVVKRVKFIDAFSARGSNVTHPAPKTLGDRPQSEPGKPMSPLDSQVLELTQEAPGPFENSFMGFGHWKRETWLAGIGSC